MHKVTWQKEDNEETPSTSLNFVALLFTMPSTTNTPNQARTRAIWRSCIASAFRTALACTIIGCTVLFGPPIIANQVTYPTLTYVTAIVIVTDATLGDIIRGLWLVLNATIQSIGPAILVLWLIGPANLSSYTTSVLVAIASFFVALPESTHLIAKRIALGQIALTYVTAFIEGAEIDAVIHCARMVATTALGVLACVPAILLPYPRLACSKVKQNCKLYAENASERLKLFGKAFCAEDKTSAHGFISQAKSLTIPGTKLLQNIKSMQESMQWERLFVKSYYMTPGGKLQDLEVPLRGMEMALTNTSFTITSLNGDLKKGVEEHLTLTLKHVKSWLTCDNTTSSSTVPESNADHVMKTLQTLQTIQPTQKNLPSFFFIFCLKLLHKEPKAATAPTPSLQKGEDSFPTRKKKEFFLKSLWGIILPKQKMLMVAFKCSISVGLATLLGIIYSKSDGYWSGLAITVGHAVAREATFKLANARAQGTVIGSVYGLLGYFLFKKFMAVRFMSLLPWFIFTGFLRRSKMYAQAGGISAITGAAFILGRKNYGAPSDFAIARIVESFIGLSCSIMVEMVMQPTRASTLAKIQLSGCLGTLHECIDSISLGASKAMLEDRQKRLKADVAELGKFIGEAEVEPNFWFLPFHSACYNKLLASFSKMVDLLFFGALAIGFLEQESHKLLEEEDNKLADDLKFFKEMLSTSINCFKEVTLIKSVALLEKELEKNNISLDIELGKSPKSELFMVSSGSEEEDEMMEKIITSYVQHLSLVVDNIQGVEGGDDVKSQIVLNLSALGFCMYNLVRETREIRKGIEELIQWENPTNHINLFEISCKIHALHN